MSALRVSPNRVCMSGQKNAILIEFVGEHAFRPNSGWWVYEAVSGG